jgi:hypothetical protein
VEYGASGPGSATVNGGDGDDTISIVEGPFATGSTVSGGLGNDVIYLHGSSTGHADEVRFGTITYDALQNPTNGQGHDTIFNFNMEFGGAGAEDVLNFDAFLVGQTLGMTDYNPIPGNPGGLSLFAIQYGDWTGGVNAVDMDVGFGAHDSAVAVIAATSGFVLNASHITSVNGNPGVEIDDNGIAVVMIAKDTNGDFNFDQADVYYVQDVDSDAGQAWKVDLVGTVNFTTEIGAITSIGLSNMTW